MAALDPRQQVREITNRLEAGMADLYESEKYQAFLNTLSKFHKYSTRNALLIHMQKPDATLVAGFQAWQNKFGRHVMKGEKAIKILAPTPYLIKVEAQKLDPTTKQPILGDDGLPVMEAVEQTIPRFKVTSVFDVSQTDGKPIPSLVESLSGDVRQYEIFIESLRLVSPLTIVFEALPENEDGVCRFGREIAIREGMSEVQTVSAIVHEIAHAKLHDKTHEADDSGEAKPRDRRAEEIQAESVSYAVCQYYGIETSANSFGYLAEWSRGRDNKELTASLDVIRKSASELIEGIDAKFHELAKERGIDLTAEINDSAAQDTVDVPIGQKSVSNQQDESEPEKSTDALAVAEKPIANDIPMPDPSISYSERDLYGYTHEDILPLTKVAALELFDSDHTIYLLYPDNTEGMALDREEIASHDGIFGIERDEWMAIQARAPEKVSLGDSEGSLESDLLHGDDSRFGIYQLKDIDELRYHRFSSMQQLERDSLLVDRANYGLVYTAPLQAFDTNTLHKIYADFNAHHPEDYIGRSVSVSDVIVLQWQGEVTAHYVDNFDFKALPSFTGDEKQKTAPVQETNMPSVSDLEADVMQGRSISLMDLAAAIKHENTPPAQTREKTSIMARLDDFNKSRSAKTDADKTASKRNDREV